MSLRLSLLVLLLLVAQGGAKAASTLAKAVKQTDAKYLKVPDVTGDDSAPKIEIGSGEETNAATREITQGTIKAALSDKEEKSEDGETVRVPVVTVFAAGKEVARLEGEDTGLPDAPVSVQIAELDPSNSYPEVVVSFFTGGAHCCSATRVVTANSDGSQWTTVDLGEFDGGPLLATDLNHDGRYEFMTRDNAFLYAFACYACSEAPLQLIGIENGKVKDLTRDPVFKPVHAAALKSMVESVPEQGDANGFLAGYVAEKILLGEGKQAWDLMLAHYDRRSDWGLDTCDKPLNQDGECPGKTIRLTFPKALERMLNENGYKVEK
jgi:hypothetical protein